jgi:hypothetical protein
MGNKKLPNKIEDAALQRGEALGELFVTGTLSLGYEKSRNASPVISKSKDTCMSILYSKITCQKKDKKGIGVPRSEALQSYFCFTLPLLKVQSTFLSLPILFMQHP